MESHQPDAVRSRQRRRRWWITAALLLVLAIAGSAAVVIANSRRSRRRTHVASSALALALARTDAKADAAAARFAAARMALAAEVADARRLAGRGKPLYCGSPRRRMVALTFDDGPGVYTRLAVKKLREYHLRATFFLVGKEIRAWPRLVGLEKPLAAFGDHTMTHPFLPALPRGAIAEQMARAQVLIERVTGEPVVLFRPPYEGRNAAVDHEGRSLGMVEVLWNVDSQDSLGANYAGIERHVIAGLRPGSIILMHENRGQTIRAMPTIFAALKRRHLQAVTVPELIAKDPPSVAQLRAGAAGCRLVGRGGNGG